MLETTGTIKTTLEPAYFETLLARIQKIPCVSSFNITVHRLDKGECDIEMPRNPEYDGIFESFHGGLLMAAADMAACFAIMTVTGEEQVMTTTDMNIRFLAPCLSHVHAKARTIKVGKSLCPVMVTLFDTQGIQVAVAQVTYMRLNKMPSR